jgi:hypothetical protein
VFCLISYLSPSILGLCFQGSSSSSSKPFNFSLVCDFPFVVLNPFQFLHYYPCAPCNMATFHGCSDLTTMVNDLRTVVVSKHCLCPMFFFHPSFLHISKDVLYDSNNLVSNSLYQIPIIASQGR